MEYQIGIPFSEYSLQLNSNGMQTFINELQGNFFLRTPKQNSPTLLYYVVRFNNKKYRFAMGVKVYPNQWNKLKQSAETSNKLSKLERLNNAIVNEKIEEYKYRLSQFKTYLCNNPWEIVNGDKLLKAFIYNNKVMDNCIEYLRKCKDEDKSISDGTKKDYKSAIDNLEKYSVGDKTITSFNELNKKYIKGYYNFLLSIDDNPRTKDGKLSIGYINKQIGQLWTMLNKYAVENEIMNLSILQEWEDRTAWEKKDKTKKNEKGIALRDDEIILLWNYWYKIKIQRDKDILATFLLECLTGQRFSDIEKITDNLNTIHTITTIQLAQQKGGKGIRVGIIFQLAKTILTEYKNQMPQIYGNDYSNKRMKIIGKNAGIQGRETITRHSGNNTHVTADIKERYELLTQHTGRRTFITLLALREWNANRIKQYSGHSDIEMVERYTKIKDSADYERFHYAIKNEPHNILRYVDEEENKKLFGIVSLPMPSYHYPSEEERYRAEIDEAKRVLSMFKVPASKFMEINDIDELRSMMYCIEHDILDVIKDRKIIKEIFNNADKSLDDKANELHKLYLECKENYPHD